MGRMELEGSREAIVRTIDRKIRWPIVLLCCWTVIQCALRPIPRDLAVYVNRDVGGISGLEEQGLKRYADLTGANFVSDQALRQALESQVIPAYTRFSVLVDAIKPRTEPVKQLHSLYRQAATLRLQGFRTILLAIDTQDPDLVRQANRSLDMARQLTARWQEGVERLAVQYGLERY